MQSLFLDKRSGYSVLNRVFVDCLRVTFLLILEDTSPFCGATDSPVLDFWCRLLWDSKSEWAALFALDRGICEHFPSGVTPADLLVASMAAEPFSSMYL